MTGWRVGWLAAPPEIVASARRHVSRTITHVPTANQRAALAALGDTGTPVEAAHDYRRRRALLVDALNGIDGIVCPLPDGGMFAFPDVSGLLRDRGWSGSADLAGWLLDTVRLAVVPNEFEEVHVQSRRRHIHDGGHRPVEPVEPAGGVRRLLAVELAGVRDEPDDGRCRISSPIARSMRKAKNPQTA